MIPNAVRHADRSTKTRPSRSGSRRTRRAAGRGAEGTSPATGLARDYLDQFDRAVMLLQLLAATPDCAGDFHAWRPRSYRDHVASSPGDDGDAAIAAYGAVDPRVRARFETLTASMTDVLVATQDVMQAAPCSPATGMLANRAAVWVGKLVAQARAVVEGTDPCCIGPRPEAPAAAGRAGR